MFGLTRVPLAALCLALSSTACAAPPTSVCTPLPADMAAMRIHEAGGPERLRLERIARPEPKAGQVLVRVRAASVNPVDWKFQQAGRLPFPAVPGGDLSGEIVAIGGDVSGWSCGDEVIATVDQAAQQGSYAEYVAVRPAQMIRKPADLSFEEGAALPTVAIAAWRYLLSAGKVAEGERVLIHGGAGGVGSMMVQMAKARGAHVIATASARNHDYLRSIGADEVIDYTTTRFEEVVRDVDLVVSTVAGDTVARSEAVLRDGGRLVTVTGGVPEAICAAGRVACPSAPGWDVPAGLAAMQEFLAADQLHVNVDRVFPLSEAAAAQALNREGHTRGKIVLRVADEAASAKPTADVREDASPPSRGDVAA